MNKFFRELPIILWSLLQIYATRFLIMIHKFTIMSQYFSNVHKIVKI